MRHELLPVSLRASGLPAEVEEGRAQHLSPGLAEDLDGVDHLLVALKAGPLPMSRPVGREGDDLEAGGPPQALGHGVGALGAMILGTMSRDEHRPGDALSTPGAPGVVERLTHALLVAPAAGTGDEDDVRERFGNHFSNHSILLSL
ncbi:hypothetical protein V1460_25390 [Streptomyces sp. SCSIO 30461]